MIIVHRGQARYEGMQHDSIGLLFRGLRHKYKVVSLSNALVLCLDIGVCRDRWLDTIHVEQDLDVIFLAHVIQDRQWYAETVLSLLIEIFPEISSLIVA